MILLAACTAPALEDVEVETDDEGLAAVVRWRTTLPGDAWLDLADRTIAGTSDAEGLRHAAVLVGLAGGVEWNWQPRSETAAGSLVGDTHTFLPPSPPEAVGPFDVEVTTPGSGWTLTTIEPVSDAVVLFDGEGRPTWWHVDEDNEESDRARMSADGSEVWFHRIHDADLATAEIVRQPLLGGEPTVIAAPESHHDFVPLADGGLYTLLTDTREVDGVPVVGDALVHIDADGVWTTLWSVWDVAAPEEPVELPPNVPALDWSHCNGIAPDEPRAVLWVSCANLDTLYAIDPAGGVEWAVGAEGDVVIEEEEAFSSQHGPFLVPEGLLVYDNRLDPKETSRAAVYTLDLDEGTATRTWTWDTGTWTRMRGSAVRLADGGTIVSTGSAGRLVELDPDDAVRWSVEISGGNQFTFASAVPTVDLRVQP